MSFFGGRFFGRNRRGRFFGRNRRGRFFGRNRRERELQLDEEIAGHLANGDQGSRGSE